MADGGTTEWRKGYIPNLPDIFLVHTDDNDDDDNDDDDTLIFYYRQAKRGFATGAGLFDLGGNGAFWKKKGVTLCGLRISEKKEILRKLTVFDDGGDSNCCSLLSRRLASIQGPSLLIIEL
jgi:hypothetical protein